MKLFCTFLTSKPALPIGLRQAGGTDRADNGSDTGLVRCPPDHRGNRSSRAVYNGGGGRALRRVYDQAAHGAQYQHGRHNGGLSCPGRHRLFCCGRCSHHRGRRLRGASGPARLQRRTNRIREKLPSRLRRELFCKSKRLRPRFPGARQGRPPERSGRGRRRGRCRGSGRRYGP